MDYVLTTIDNPFHPSTEFDEWYDFDTRHGYHTVALLARFAVTSDELGEEENRRSIQRAIDDIVRLNPDGIHRKIPIKSVDDSNTNSKYQIDGPS